jgi:hypothetical protein
VRDARAAEEWCGNYSPEARDVAAQLWAPLRDRLADLKAPDRLRRDVLAHTEQEAAT